MNGGLKIVDITFEIIRLKWCWVKRLHDSSAHDWKLIPLHIIIQNLGKQFFFSFKTIYIDPKKTRQFPRILSRNIIKVEQ